ncbi:glycosyltransferase [uncultured Polaribacter sp.]|uniref:glycosyltransferase n=1 Tax=uncultured Polaribacter sp. TaxID=174711 RepID=UPI0037049F5A
MNLLYSIIIPVYNRPNEIDELLDSLTKQDFTGYFEVLIIEDGSAEKSDLIVEKYKNQLHLKYFFKENSGAGASRNFGMTKATGNYFIILDSDVILPYNYLAEITKQLEKKYTDAFGGPDAAHPSFSVLQKAINYSMTSFLTTGGIRGNKKSVGKFQPRSFNMGLSQKAFDITKGFSNMRAGEDIDLSFRLWDQGLETQLIDAAYVYHKRRNSFLGFFQQTFAFGTARPKLNKKYPTTAKLTYWFPSIFILGLDLSILLSFFGVYIPILLYTFYFLLIGLDAFLRNNFNPLVGFLSIITALTQFLGYGLGFLESMFISKK